jgi:osmotically inducible lipoprotein OsmB
MLRKIVLGALLGSMAMGLGACGDDPGTRAVTGGLIGAGGAAAIACGVDRPGG